MNKNHEILKRLLKHYNLGRPRWIKMLPNALYQRITLIKTSKGKFVIKYWDPKNHIFAENWKSLPKLLASQGRLLDYLNGKKFPVPHLIKTKTSRYIQKIDDRIYMITTFITGRKPELSLRDISIVGYSLGLMQRLTNSYNDMPENKLIDTILTYRKKFGILKDVIGEKTVMEIDNEIELTVSALPDLNDLQKCVCHGDLSREHIFIKNGNLSGIIDFDTSGIDYAVSDLGVAMLHFCFTENNLSPKLLTVFLKAYLRGRKYIHAKEIKAVYPSLQLALIKYTLWEINDINLVFKRKPKITDIVFWKRLKHLNQLRNKEIFEEIVKCSY